MRTSCVFDDKNHLETFLFDFQLGNMIYETIRDLSFIHQI